MSYRIILSSNYSPWSTYSGGGQRSTHQLAQVFGERGYDVHVIYSKVNGEKVHAPKDLNYEIHWAEYPGIKSSRKNLFRSFTTQGVKKHITRLYQPGMVYHANGEESALVNELKSSNQIRFILTPRYPSIKGVYPRKKSRFSFNFFPSKYALLGQSFQGCDIYCPTSKFALDTYKNHYPLDGKAFQVIPNGIPKDFLSLGEPNSYDEKIRLIFFGRLSREKGIDVLLNAAKRISGQIDEIVIVGRGDFEHEIKALNSQGPLKNKLNLKSWLEVPELIREIRQSTIAVLPSLEESFGNAILEAMACGIPVISTNVGSIPELITSPNEGKLIPPGDDKSLETTILDLIQSPETRKEIGINAQLRVQENYSWESTADQYLSVYERISF